MDRWAKLKRLARVAPAKPREVFSRFAHVLEVKWDAVASRPPPYTWVSVAEGEERLANGLGFDLAARRTELDLVAPTVDASIEDLRDNPPMTMVHCATGGLARTAYLAARALTSGVVLETGVAYGVTSRYVLEGLCASGSGRLESIDLPPLGDEAGDHVGWLITEAQRPRWTLHRGSSARVLPGLLERLGAVQMFIHDSLHTYKTMRWEFETVWPFLPEGGVLLSDDIAGNAAFQDFASDVRPAQHWTVRESDGTGCFGVIIK